MVDLISSELHNICLQMFLNIWIIYSECPMVLGWYIVLWNSSIHNASYNNSIDERKFFGSSSNTIDFVIPYGHAISHKVIHQISSFILSSSNEVCYKLTYIIFHFIPLVNSIKTTINHIILECIVNSILFTPWFLALKESSSKTIISTFKMKQFISKHRSIHHSISSQ